MVSGSRLKHFDDAEDDENTRNLEVFLEQYKFFSILIILAKNGKLKIFWGELLLRSLTTSPSILTEPFLLTADNIYVNQTLVIVKFFQQHKALFKTKPLF